MIRDYTTKTLTLLCKGKPRSKQQLTLCDKLTFWH